MAKYHNVANPERNRAMIGLRASSAAQPHKDSRTKRARTRHAALRRALKEAA